MGKEVWGESAYSQGQCGGELTCQSSSSSSVPGQGGREDRETWDGGRIGSRDEQSRVMGGIKVMSSQRPRMLESEGAAGGDGGTREKVLKKDAQLSSRLLREAGLPSSAFVCILLANN